VSARAIPNAISLFRITLVVPIAVTMIQSGYDIALGLFVVAGASDGLDGYLARRFNWVTPLGALLDPIGDKLLMVTCYLVLGWLGDLPWWLVSAVILRDVVIVVGAVFYRFLIGEVVYRALLISKLNTVLQILLVMITLALLAGFRLLAPLQPLLVYLVLLTTLSSGVAYVVLWGRQAAKHSKAKRS